MEFNREINNKHLEILAYNSGFQFTKTFFPCKSGKIGNYHVRSEVVLKDGHHYREAIYDLRNLIDATISTGEYDIVSGGENRDWIFSYPLAFLLAKKHVSLYKNGKVLGDLSNKRAVHISDLDNGGFSINKWSSIIKNKNGDIKNIFFYIDKCEDGVLTVNNTGIESRALVYLNSESWDYLLNIKAIDKETHSAINERFEDKEKWARNMLTSDAGIKRIAELCNSKKRNAMLDVIDNHPDIKEDILERLKGV